MLTPSITLRRGIRVVRGAAWGAIAAAVIAAMGFTAANAASACPASADCDVVHRDVSTGGGPVAIPVVVADRAPCREAGLRRTKHDGPAGARGKVQGVVEWIADASAGRRHGRRPRSAAAGAIPAPSVDLSRLCRLTC